MLEFVMPEDTPSGETAPDSGWRDADLERAIAAAQSAGLRDYRVEISPDGTIAIVVGLSSEAAPDP